MYFNWKISFDCTNKSLYLYKMNLQRDYVKHCSSMAQIADPLEEKTMSAPNPTYLHDKFL